MGAVEKFLFSERAIKHPEICNPSTTETEVNVLTQPREQLLLDLIEPEGPTLDNFVCGQNGEVVAALKNCLAGEGPQFIYLWGPSGCGKTHLLRAMTPCQRWRVPEFDEDVAIYTVDNVQELDAEDLEKLFHLMNAVRSHPDTRIIVSGNVSVAELNIREDITTRLSWGLVYRIRYLPGDLAQAEFDRLAKERGIEMTPDLAQWVVTHLSRDMRDLRRYLDVVDRFAMRNKRRVTLPLLQECLQQFSRS